MRKSGTKPVKCAYLTIDDAPSRDFRDKVDALRRYEIPAVFFCVGEFMPGNWSALQYAVQCGYLIGNHSLGHPHFSDLSLEACQQEISKTDEMINSLYGSLGMKRPAWYFRFPYFDSGGDASGEAYEAKWARPRSEWYQYENAEKRLALQRYLRDMGYCQPVFEGVNLSYSGDANMFNEADVRCTFDQGEYWLNRPEAPWGLSTAEAILARMDEDFPYEGRALNRTDSVAIILVHDQAQTSALFYRILERYVEKGIRFLPIP